MDNNEGERQESSSERVNDLIDKGGSTYENAKRVKRGGKAAGKAVSQGGKMAARASAAAARAAAQAWAQVAAATSETWISILLIAVGVILFLFIITGVISFLFDDQKTAGLCSGSCRITCLSSETQDTNGVCSPSPTGENQVCCISTTKLACSDVAGQCVSGPTCPSGTEENTATCNDSAASLCCTPISDDTCDTDPDTYLKRNFNAVVMGTTRLSDKTYVCNTLVHNSKAANYKRLLTNGGTLTIRLNDSGIDYCGGLAEGANLIRLGPCNAPLINKMYLLTHESGHMISKRNSTFFNRYTWTLLRSQDSSCYSRDGFLISYPLRYYCNGVDYRRYVDARKESWAESIATYIYYSSYIPRGFCAVPLTRFPTQCDNTYAWFENNFFGGYNF